MSTLKETKVEAKGVSKNNKKYTLQAKDDSTLHFLCGNKEDESFFQLDSRFVTNSEKKKLTLVSEEQQINYSISFNSEEEANHWLDLIKTLIEESSAKYFDVNLMDTVGPNMISFIIEDSVKRLRSSKDTSGIFRISGSKVEIENLKRAYRPNNAELLKLYDEHAITAFLKMYLRRLPDPLCTFDYYDKFLSIANSDEIVESIKSVVQMLPQVNQVNLKYLMMFLKEVSDLSDTNMMNAGNLSIVMGPNILRPRVEATELSNDGEIANRVIAAMIQNAPAIFISNPKSEPKFLGIGKIPLKAPPKFGLPPLPKQPKSSESIGQVSPMPKIGLPPHPLSQSNPSLKIPPTFTPNTPPKLKQPESSEIDSSTPKDSLTRSPSEKQLSKSKKDADDDWKEYTTDDGKKYYHNETTNLTQWIKPEALIAKQAKIKKHKKRSSNHEGKLRSVTVALPKLKKPSKDDVDIISSKGLNSPSIPPPLTPPPVIEDSIPLSDSDRIKALEKKVSELENTVKSQGELIERLLTKIN